MRCFNLFFAALLSASAASEARAFTVLAAAADQNARWRQPTIRFLVNYEHAPISREQVDAVLDEGFSLWNAVAESNLRVEHAGETHVSGHDLLTQATAETAIVFDPDFATDLPGSSRSVLAVGSAINKGDSYTQGMILINLAALRAHGRSGRLSRIIAHEAGHVLGLGHTTEASALMYPVSRPIDQLAEDDVQGVTFLYPRKEMWGEGALGCSRLASRGNQLPPRDQGPMKGAALMLVVFFVAWRAALCKRGPCATKDARV